MGGVVPFDVDGSESMLVVPLLVPDHNRIRSSILLFDRQSSPLSENRHIPQLEDASHNRV
jgi:hypothetical protein